MKRKFLTHFPAFLIMALFVVNSQVVPQSVDIPEHPNHYILLIDSSASTVSSQTEFSKYREILTETLLQRLYRDGFGNSIPRYNPAEDMLSLLHFGIVPKGKTPPYSYLADYDLLEDFVQRRITREKDISESYLKTIIMPEDFFRLTILIWAKSLALNELLKDEFSGPCSRVFLIMVHDGVVNDGTIREEINLAEKWSNRDRLPQVKAAIQFIDKNYMFSNGSGQTGCAWEKTISVQGNPYFMEAYEVVSRKQKEWESRLLNLSPFDRSTFSWERERGENPAGVLRVNISKPFLDLFTGNDTEASASLAFTCRNDREVKSIELNPLINFSMIMSEPLPCQPLNGKMNLTLSISQQENLLGKRTLGYRADKEIETPLPTICTVTYWVRTVATIGGILIFSILVVWLFVWMYIYSQKKTHLKIKFPGLSFPIRIDRNKTMEGTTPIHPIPSVPAFTLLLPARWKQSLLYSRAVISLESGSDSRLYLQNGSLRTGSIQLPIKTKKINAWWNAVPPEPINITVTFSQGKQKSEIHLYFPAGISDGGSQ